MKEEKLYRRVYIESEKDLPKEGLYFCVFSDDCFGSFPFNPDDEDDIDFWTGNVMWYLEEVPLPTEEDIIKQSEKEIDPGVIDDFYFGKTHTAIRRRMWSYGVKWLLSQINNKYS